VDPRKVDELLVETDGTSDKSRLGSNAILGVSMAAFKAAALEEGVELSEYISSSFELERSIPRPCFNVVNGGVHSGSNVSFQEFMVVPHEESFEKNLRFASELLHALKSAILKDYGVSSVDIGDEGGFSIKAGSSQEILSFLSKNTKKTSFLIDVAATEFHEKGNYLLDGKVMNRDMMISFYEEIMNDFPIIGIEDPLEENDFSGFRVLTEKMGETMIVGDDLLVTNLERMERANKEGSCNAMILKINQIGSVSESILAAKKAKEFGWKIIVSHRSGETNDDFISDLAVGVGADHIKAGAPQRGERVAKYNRLLKLENNLKGCL